MPEDLTPYKRQAAEYAVEKFVESGMVIGLGHGSTAVWAVRRIAELVRSSELHDITCVPCSLAVERDARELGLSLIVLDGTSRVDVTIDGADEASNDLNVIKGGGGALLREKVVGQATERYVIVADVSKRSPVLGSHWPVPVEVIPFALGVHRRFLESLGGRPALRRTPSQQPFKTDQGNFILDCAFGPISNPRDLAARLAAHAGVVEHGLFLDMVTDLIIAGPDGVTARARGD